MTSGQELQELVFEDAMAVFQEKLNQVGRRIDPLMVQEWEIVMEDETFSSYVVMFLRFLTSCEIQLRREFFEPFIMVSAKCFWRSFIGKEEGGLYIA